MKKINLIFFTLVFALMAPITGFSQQKDFLVLLDTSKSMFDHYQTVVNVFFTDVLKEKVKTKDFFHLISFSDKPEIEISLKLEKVSDSESVLKRLLLLKALGENTDLLTGLSFVNKYGKEIKNTDPRTIAIFTDGVHNPSTKENRSLEVVTAALRSSLTTMKDAGWEVIFYQIPAAPDPSTLKDGEMLLPLKSLSEELGFKTKVFDTTTGTFEIPDGSVKIILPPKLGELSKKFSLPVTFENPNKKPAQLKLLKILFNDMDLLKDPIVFTVPGNEKIGQSISAILPVSNPKIKEGPNTGKLKFVFEGENKGYPAQMDVSFDYKPSLDLFDFETPVPWIIILVILLIILLVFFLTRGKKTKKQDENEKSFIRGQKKNDSEEKKILKKVENIDDPSSILKKTDQSSQFELLKKSPPIQKKSLDFANQSNNQKNEVSNLSDSTPIIKGKVSLDQLIQSREDQPKSEAVNYSQKSTNSKISLDSIIHAQENTKELVSETRKVPGKIPLESQGFQESVYTTPSNHTKKRPLESASSNMMSYSSQHGNGGMAEITKTSIEKTEATKPVTRKVQLTVETEGPLYQTNWWNQNVRVLRSGESKTLGGLSEFFKILLVPISKPIAEIAFDGVSLKLNPIIKEYFPKYIPENILDQKLTIDIPGQKPITICFHSFQSKTEEINSILRS